VDVALKVFFRNEEGMVESCFNPCFRGCRSESMAVSSPPGIEMNVSILVFVDVALKADSTAQVG